MERRIEFGEYGRIGAAAKATRERPFRGEQAQTPEQRFTGSAISDTPTPEQRFAPPLNSGSGGPVNSGSHRTIPFEQYLLNRPRAGASARATTADDGDRSLENAEPAREAYQRLRDRLAALRPGESWPPGRIAAHIGAGLQDRLSLVDLRRGTLPLTVAEAESLTEAFRRMAVEMLPAVARVQDAADRRAGLIPLEGGKAKQDLVRPCARPESQPVTDEADEAEREALLGRMAAMIERERGEDSDAAAALARLVMSCIQGHQAVVDAVSRERAVPDDELWSLIEEVITDLDGIAPRRA